MLSFFHGPGGGPRVELLLLVVVACMLLVTYSSLQSAREEQESIIESATKVDLHEFLVVTTSSSTPTTTAAPLSEPASAQADPEQQPQGSDASLDTDLDILPADGTDSASDYADTLENDPAFPSPVDPSPSPNNNKIFKAVLIETSLDSPSLIPILLHFSSVLPAHWSLVVFTSPNDFALPSSVPFRNLVSSKRVEIRFLPKETAFTNSASVSTFLASSDGWLWNQLLDAERVLLFQLDSILCANSVATIDDFAKWDFVGAPIDRKYGEGYNGGLSIRNPRLFLEVVKTGNYTVGFEDQWFYQKLKERREVGRDWSVRLPGVEDAKRFAVETVWGERPLGYHQPQRWWKGKDDGRKWEEIEKWCPEVGMLIGRRAK